MGHVSAAVAAAAAGHDESTGCDTDGSPRRPQRGARSKPRGRGRDKPNLNHLLNFSLPVRLPPPTPVRPRRHAAGAVDERAAAASRAAFINANFRFVLKPVHWPALMAVARRPDMALRAEWIERVVVPTAAAAANCPICLSSPAAARITKCGHLYCLPCILRHLSYGDSADESPKKCPVCWCSISADSLLPVHMWTTHYDAACPRLPPRRGPGAAAAARNVVRMRLMRRRRGSTVCLPRASVPPACAADPVDAAHFPWTFTDDALPFAKALLAAEDYCADEYRREIRELQRVRDDEEPDSEPRLFTEAALMTVEAALDAARTPAADWRRLEEQARAAQLAPPRNSATSEETRAEPPGSSGASGHAADEEETDSDSDDVYYIYQADDGQHIYMHPLHMRILAHDRGGYAALPDSIEIKPRYAVESVITDEVRRRFRFLDHLPLRCEITVVEPELRGVVARASSDKFRTQLAHHDRQHAARARSAAADEARAEMVAAAAAAAATAAAIQAAEACGSPAYCALPAASLAADRPDISGFPALGEPASPASGNSSRAADRRNGPAWPRQPSGAPGGGGTVHGDIWARFERAADSANGGGSGYGSDHDADRGDDPEDCSIPVKNPTAPAVAPQGSDKKKRGANKGPKLMLSGASTRRSR
ncbi:hypothetical protein IWQ56_003633 [Coemansia nantahalensis]|nr:hypothetical protein IWQ56_003633 [Coemansia nantahalensis]